MLLQNKYEGLDAIYNFNILLWKTCSFLGKHKFFRQTDVSYSQNHLDINTYAIRHKYAVVEYCI